MYQDMQKNSANMYKNTVTSRIDNNPCNVEAHHIQPEQHQNMKLPHYEQPQYSEAQIV